MAKETTVSKTKYIELTGKVFWAKVYEPDEFRGTVRWSMDFYPLSDEDWKKFKDAGIQKEVKENENGKKFQVTRPKTKLMKGKIVYFTPPIIYDKEGNVLIKYVDKDGKIVRSYDDAEFEFKREGQPILIGNGSTVSVTLSVYPTAMGPGNRLESIKLVDLIEYKKPEPIDETRGHEVAAEEEVTWP